MESKVKRFENTINDFAKKLEFVSYTNMVTKEELLREFVAKDVMKNKLITDSGQMLIEYEKKLYNFNQIVKSYEDYIIDNN